MRLLPLTLSLILSDATSAASKPRAKSITSREESYPKYAVKTPPLDTPWTYDLGTDPWPEYPRPLMRRSDWKSLNGIWRYQNASASDQEPPIGAILDHEVLVPSCLESAISGLQGTYTIYSWFSHDFLVPSSWQSRKVLLNFGAVDYEATVYINGNYVTFKRGGYASFSTDITDHVHFNSSNALLVFVHDPTDSDDIVIPIGKQTLRPSHIFYTPCSGIWQSVWIEAVPTSNYISQLDLDGDMHGKVSLLAHSATRGRDKVNITIREGGQTDTAAATASFDADFPTEITMPFTPKLWSPDSPVLYDVTIQLGSDTIESYVGFRSIASQEVNGVVRPMLNGEFIFTVGTLDQGYWPDGIYVPPNHSAMVYDLHILKIIGFNLVRKHIKIESDLFYAACDRLGLLIIQDMPSPRPLQTKHYPNCTSHPYLPNATEQADFVRQLQTMIHQLKSHPSIFAWTIYNEGWGQPLSPTPNGTYAEHGLTTLVRTLDPTRLITATSGWTDHGAGDFSDTHTYASPKCGTPFYKTPSPPYDPTRIALQGEFGGIGHNVSASHLWPLPAAVATINQTYELADDLDTYNYRAHQLWRELREQVDLFACSGAVWTQTTDVEGELNGLLTYDRRVLRVDLELWRRDIQELYDAAERRGARPYQVPQPVRFDMRP
ncbi:uncharacterized protein HMPREF1541_02410 [Cyphellophora europaea CBS 101466]|uniref:Uncharacterized protein n=1 Tax=Cyphellophora europaea (strain CBS 101466) TaxID=1220924 RepID=W2S3G1_CYPE1|nr:uncharacterized protein HMPREF1541_02410 [Cyphellophora europaea CBS 101466]ETN43251.1 hypothetical protein HMPREF1541_02410 [Cyphellophora europaea CBS 101466]